MKNHTKGKWHIHLTTKQSIEIWTDDNGKGRICTLTNRKAIEEQANAKLIANAPELLDNLIRLVNRIEENELNDHFPSAFRRSKEIISKTIN